jgi:hypothetical protein
MSSFGPLVGFYSIQSTFEGSVNQGIPVDNYRDMGVRGMGSGWDKEGFGNNLVDNHDGG